MDIVKLIGHEDTVRGVDIAPDGSFLVTGSEDGTVRLWDPITGKPLSVISVEAGVGALALSTDGKLVAIGCKSGLVKVIDVETRSTLHRFTGHKSLGSSIAFSRNGIWILSATWQESDAELWNLTKGQLERKVLAEGGQQAASVAFSPDDHLMAIGTGDGIVIYELKTGEKITQFRKNFMERCHTLQFLDNETIGTIVGHNIYKGKVSNNDLPLIINVGATAGRTAGAFSFDGKRVIVGDAFGRVSEWDIESGSQLMDWTGEHSEQVMALAYLPGSYSWVSGDISGEVRLWLSDTPILPPTVATDSQEQSATMKENTEQKPNKKWWQFWRS